jgi:hypothetical protein
MHVWIPSEYETVGTGPTDGPALSKGYLSVNDYKFRLNQYCYIPRDNQVFEHDSSNDPRNDPEVTVKPGDLWKPGGTAAMNSWSIATTPYLEWAPYYHDHYIIYRNVADGISSSTYGGPHRIFKRAMAHNNYHNPGNMWGIYRFYATIPCISIKDVREE